MSDLNNETPRLKSPTDPLESSRMPLTDHLDDLRKGLIRSLLVIGVAFCGTYQYVDEIVRFLEQPLLVLLPEDAQHLYFTGIADKFITYFKVSFLAAVAVSGPYVLWELWRFVAPALYRNEKRFLLPFMIFGSLSFILGLAFGYYVVIPYGYEFLIGYGSSTDQAMITLNEYFSLTLKLLGAMGLVFELPVVIILLGKMGIVNATLLTAYRRHAFVVISIVAAILTPTPDAMTLLLVMIPLYLLYEVSIVGVRFFSKST